MTIAYIGLGSNMNSPKQQIKSAIESIEKIAAIQVLMVSSLYKSKPMGPQNQHDYINAVAKIDTDLIPYELLECMQDIENDQGRIRKERWGPRTLDLDILLFGQQQIETPTLTIPHYGMRQREFVLYPLYEIAPSLIFADGCTLKQLIDEVPLNGITQL